MSKIEQLKKQYPTLSFSFVDLAKIIDVTKSHKYTPVICKILSESLTVLEDINYKDRVNHIKRLFEERNVLSNNLTVQEMYIYSILLDRIDSDILETIQDLMEYGERKLLPTKDILKYKSIEEVKRDVNIASLRDSEKNYESQIYKEFENETWVVLRPLTYLASIKYGASTKWCTTSRYEKEYFAKYWDRGVLVYFINKKTGYKFAGYKEIKKSDELSFWNSVDNRIDSLEIECESYLYDIIKNIFKSDKSNSDLCGFELKLEVANECKYILYDSIKNLHISEPIEENIRMTINADENFTLTNIDYENMIDYGTITDTTYVTNEAFQTPTRG